MNELRKLKSGFSTKRGDPLVVVQHGQIPFDEWEEQQRYWHSPRAPQVSPSSGAPPMSLSPRAPLVSPSSRAPPMSLSPRAPLVSTSPRAPLVSPTGSPRTPGGSQKKPVLGKVKSKAKKWMHLLRHKKKPAIEEVMWTPRIGPSGDDIISRMELHDDELLGTPSTAKYTPSFAESERTPEVYMEASPRQNSPLPSQEQPYFKVSSRFESEMKEANEMLMESKQLRVKTSKQKNVTFAPRLECGTENENNSWGSRELSETAADIFRDAYSTVYEAALKMVSRIQDIMVAYDIDRRNMVEKVISFNRYLMLKLEPGQDDKVLAEVITDAVLNLLDAWTESVERPLMQRTKEISSWFLQEEREELPPVPLSTHPCAYEDAEEFYSLEN